MLPPLRAGCPAGACICKRAALMQDPDADWRVLRLSALDEKNLVQRLQSLRDLLPRWHAALRQADAGSAGTLPPDPHPPPRS